MYLCSCFNAAHLILEIDVLHDHYSRRCLNNCVVSFLRVPLRRSLRRQLDYDAHERTHPQQRFSKSPKRPPRNDEEIYGRRPLEMTGNVMRPDTQVCGFTLLFYDLWFKFHSNKKSVKNQEFYFSNSQILLLFPLYFRIRVLPLTRYRLSITWTNERGTT